ncbi:MAG: hypothetical protein JWR52_2867 [Marmoricola sp.]|nr:hypothetical protein [Marmoricola sp.]
MVRQTAMKIQRVLLIVPATLLVAACGAAATSHSTDSTVAATKAGLRSGESFSVSAPQPVGLAPQPAAVGAPSTTGASLGATGSGAATGGTAGSGASTNDTGVSAGPAIISKGQISLTTKHIDRARFKLQQYLDRWNGTIASEQSTADQLGHTDQTRLELRIPSSRFDDAMNQLPALGKLVDRSRSSEDVTTQVIDNNARVRSQQLSLDRIQALLAQAQNLNQIIAIESQLSQRQADLDSLEQQQKYLADQTSLATIDLYLTVPGKAPVVLHPHKSFWSGLKSGWNALGTSTTAVLNAVGAVLPFALVLGLVGYGGWLTWRRRTTKALADPGPLEV